MTLYGSEGIIFVDRLIYKDIFSVKLCPKRFHLISTSVSKKVTNAGKYSSIDSMARLAI